jgi:hypothetical protein
MDAGICDFLYVHDLVDTYGRIDHMYVCMYVCIYVYILNIYKYMYLCNNVSMYGSTYLSITYECKNAEM